MVSINDIPLRAWALIVASALFQILIFPIAGPVPVLRAAIGWFALVPFFLAILLPAKLDRPLRLLSAAAIGYLCGILWYAGNCYWIYQTMYLYGGLPKPVSLGILILFALYLGLYHALFAASLLWMRRSRLGIYGALLAAPFLWVAIELARGRITGFPWDLYGYSQIDNLLLTRIAPIAGVMALSFVLVAVNAALSGFFLLRSRANSESLGPLKTFVILSEAKDPCISLFPVFRYWMHQDRIGSRLRVAIPATAAILAILLQLSSNFGRRYSLASANQTAILVQENLEVGAVGRTSKPLSSSEEIETFSQMSLHPKRASSETRQPTVVVWPEAPSHFFTIAPTFREYLGDLARTLHAPAIVGALGIEPTQQNDKGYFEYDSAALFDSDGNYRGHYDKIHLVPWGEYVPFKQFFGFAKKLTEGVGDMDPGNGRSVFSADGHAYGVFICYESIFGDEVRHFAANGAQVLVNISDDGWYGDTGAPWQHLNMTRMRAIENRRWLLLDTNTGITTSIDPQGRTLLSAPRHTRDAYVFPFAFTSGTTFYTRHGDWFAWLCLVLTLVAICFGFLQPRQV
jgi:apolipoprotein N-acyltransferase